MYVNSFTTSYVLVQLLYPVISVWFSVFSLQCFPYITLTSVTLNYCMELLYGSETPLLSDI